jgi:hypothetical protein
MVERLSDAWESSPEQVLLFLGEEEWHAVEKRES